MTIKTNNVVVPKDAIRGWHFLDDSGNLTDYSVGYAQPTGPKAEKGDIFFQKCCPCCCYGGLHASIQLSDALYHAPGPVLCRVDNWGDLDMSTEGDKHCSTHRRVRWITKLEGKFMDKMCIELIAYSTFYDYKRLKSFQKVIADLRAGKDLPDDLWTTGMPDSLVQLFNSYRNYPASRRWRFMKDAMENCWYCLNRERAVEFINTTFAAAVQKRVWKK